MGPGFLDEEVVCTSIPVDEGDTKVIDFWSQKITSALIHEVGECDDASHDLHHFKRVATLALRLAREEGGEFDPLVILAAALLHDIVSLPKNHPRRETASLLAADRAEELLKGLEFPVEKIPLVKHAIIAHSFSANVMPETLEARCVQDADRMEALGALGLMRVFYTSGRLGSQPYCKEDLLAERGRELDDRCYALDHFPLKLFRLEGLMHTRSAKTCARKRTQFLEYFRMALHDEATGGEVGGPAHSVMKILYEAGRRGEALFDPGDPCAARRDLTEGSFAFDKLLAHKRDEMAEGFISQLVEELHAM